MTLRRTANAAMRRCVGGRDEDRKSEGPRTRSSCTADAQLCGGHRERNGSGRSEQTPERGPIRSPARRQGAGPGRWDGRSDIASPRSR